ncbi:MAG: hypothetical protein ACSHYF_03310 [Verrucomicrobiaceae bacterium]
MRVVERYEDGRVHLNNLKDDLGERKDVKGAHGARVEEMRAKLHAWYREVDAKFLQKKKGQEEKPWRPGKG